MRSMNLVITKSRGSIVHPVQGIIMHTMDGLPWKQEGLRRWFDDLTEGGAVIMSNTTMKNMKEPLPGRKNIVIRMKDLKEAEKIAFPVSAIDAKSMEEAMNIANWHTKVRGDITIVGEGSVLNAVMNNPGMVDRIFVIEMDEAGKDGRGFRIDKDLFVKEPGDITTFGNGYSRTAYMAKDRMWLFYDKCDMGLEWEDGITDNGMLLAARAQLPEGVGSVYLSLHKPGSSDSYVTMRCRIYPHMGLKETRCDMTMPLRIKDIWTAKKKAEFFLVDALKERQDTLRREVMQLMEAKSKLKNVSRAISACSIH